MVSGNNGYDIYSLSLNQVTLRWDTYELHRDKTIKMACVPSEDSDQPWHPPCLIRVFRSAWASAQSDQSLRLRLIGS